MNAHTRLKMRLKCHLGEVVDHYHGALACAIEGKRDDALEHVRLLNDSADEALWVLDQLERVESNHV